MSKNKILSIALIVVFAMSAMAISGMFAITGDTKPTNVYTAQSDNGRCSPNHPNFELANSPYDPAEGSLMGESIWFGVSYHPDSRRTTIYCDVNAPECRATIQIYKAGGMAVGVCPISASIRNKDDLKNKCPTFNRDYGAMLFGIPKTVDTIAFNKNTYYWKNNEKLVILTGSYVPIGGFSIKVVADVHDLLGLTSDNFATTGVGTCNLNYMNADATVSQSEVSDLVASGVILDNNVFFGQEVNYITGLSKVYDTTRIVQKSNGEWVYIRNIDMGQGVICPLDKTIDGKTYTDCGDPKYEASIICMPYMVSGDRQCSEDGTEWTTEELTCTWYGGGVPSGYIQNGDQMCLAKCEDGEIVYHSCRDILDCETGYEFNPSLNRCVLIGSGGSGDDDDEDDDDKKTCKLDAECNDNIWWTYDSCDRTTWQEILNQEGLCKHTDLKALMIIGVGIFMVLLVAIVMSGRKR